MVPIKYFISRGHLSQFSKNCVSSIDDRFKIIYKFADVLNKLKKKTIRKKNGPSILPWVIPLLIN